MWIVIIFLSFQQGIYSLSYFHCDVQVIRANLDVIAKKLNSAGVLFEVIGQVTSYPSIEVFFNETLHLNENTSYLRDLWPENRFFLER